MRLVFVEVLKYAHSPMYMYLCALARDCVCVCVCVCERERERERERGLVHPIQTSTQVWMSLMDEGRFIYI